MICLGPRVNSGRSIVQTERGSLTDIDGITVLFLSLVLGHTGGSNGRVSVCKKKREGG